MIYFNYPLRLLFLFLLIPLLVLFFYDLINRKKIAKWYPITPKVFQTHQILRGIACFCLMLALIFAIFAFAGPYKHKNDVKKQLSTGVETLFLVDVSKSMLAEDVVPSRLERVKLDIIDFSARHPESKFALIAFAGSAVIKSPLTSDSYFFTSAVKELNAGSVSRGSTSLASALQKALKMFPDHSSQIKRNFIVFSDGEDHEDDPLPIAKKIESMGGRLLFIVLGNEKEGSRIPIYQADGSRSYLLDNGREVWTKPNITKLLTITENCPNSMLVPAYDRHYLFEEVYNQFISKVGNATVSSSEGEIQVKVHYCLMPFIIASFVFSLLSLLLFYLSKWRLKFEE